MTSRTGWVALFIVASSAFAQRPSEFQLNKDCKNDVHLGMNSSGGNVSAFGGSLGSNVCVASEISRWALLADATIIKVDAANETKNVQRRDIEGSYERYFRRTWYAVLDVSHDADNSQGLESRFIIAPGVGAALAPKWGVFRIETGVAHTWQNLRGQPRSQFPEAWSSSSLLWAIRPAIIFKEKVDVYANFDDRQDYRYRSVTDLLFRVTKSFSLSTGLQYKWDHVPAPGYKRTDWTTYTAFVFAWGNPPAGKP